MNIPTAKKPHLVSCQDCNQLIKFDHYSKHVSEIHKKTRKPCPHCHLGFSVSNLSRHIRNRHNNETVECPECHETILIDKVNVHVTEVHDGSFNAIKNRILEVIRNKTNVNRGKCDAKRERILNRLNYFDKSAEIRDNIVEPSIDESSVEPSIDESIDSIVDPFIDDFKQSDCCYFIPKGFRMIDFNILNSALKKAQRCGHPDITLTEIQNEGSLASMLAFLCCGCGAKTVFPNSSFSRKSSRDYNINKVMLPLLGDSGYSALCDYMLESDDNIKVELSQSGNGDVDFMMRTFEEKVNLVCEPIIFDVKQEPFDEEDHIENETDAYQGSKRTNECGDKEVNMKEEKEEPLENETQAYQDSKRTNECGDREASIKEETGTEPTVKREIEHVEMNEMVEPKKIKLEEELGSKNLIDDFTTIAVPEGLLSLIPRGTKITSSKVERASTETYQVPPGVYRFVRNSDLSESVLIIKDTPPVNNVKPKLGGNCKLTSKLGHKQKKSSKVEEEKAVIKKTPHIRTALQMFSRAKEIELTKTFPKLKPQDISSMIVHKWSLMSNEEKAVYRAKVFENVNITNEVNDVDIVGQNIEKKALPSVHPLESVDNAGDSQNRRKATTIRSALQMFSKEKEVELRKEFPQYDPAQISSVIIRRWINMSEKEKGVYRKKVFEGANTSKTANNDIMETVSVLDEEFIKEEQGILTTDPSLPEGWYRTVTRRKTGRQSGRFDVRVYGLGRSFNSVGSLKNFCTRNNITEIDPETINFSPYKYVHVDRTFVPPSSSALALLSEDAQENCG